MPARHLPEFTFGGATYDADAALAHGWIDEAVGADELPRRAITAAQCLANLSPAARADQEAASPRRPPIASVRSGAMTDQTVADIWIEALGYVRDYVARTLNK